ncbi:MAG: hypothetical protein WCJ56_02375 [bacterium]
MADDDNNSKQIRQFLGGKLKGYSFPVILMLIATALFKPVLDNVAAKDGPLISALVSLCVFFVILLVSSLIYIIQLLITELGKKSEYTAELEKEFMKRRKTTGKEK